MRGKIMKLQTFLFTVAFIVGIVFFGCESNIAPASEAQGTLDKLDCTTIQSGLLVDSQGDPITVGYTDFGYNYQSHIYNGDYGYPDWKLVMKWSDSWLSNKDCDGDGLLDRHYGHESYIGSGAWLTNHWTTTYINADGVECEYDDFIKIVAAPTDATVVDGNWVNADGTIIGPVIWGQFAIIQSIINDPCEGIEGVDYKSADHPGLGNW